MAGLIASHDIRDIVFIQTANGKILLVAKNSGPLQVLYILEPDINH